MEPVLANLHVLLTFIFKGQNLEVLLIFCAVPEGIWDISKKDIIKTNGIDTKAG